MRGLRRTQIPERRHREPAELVLRRIGELEKALAQIVSPVVARQKHRRPHGDVVLEQGASHERLQHRARGLHAGLGQAKEEARLALRARPVGEPSHDGHRGPLRRRRDGGVESPGDEGPRHARALWTLGRVFPGFGEG